MDICDFKGYHDSVEVNGHLYSVTKMKILDELLPDTVSANRGRSSWERMFISQPPPPYNDGIELQGSYAASDAMVENERTEEGRGGWMEDPIAIPLDGTLRSIMDVAEKVQMECDGIFVKWNNVKLAFPGTLMNYEE